MRDFSYPSTRSFSLERERGISVGWRNSSGSRVVIDRSSLEGIGRWRWYSIAVGKALEGEKRDR